MGMMKNPKSESDRERFLIELINLMVPIKGGTIELRDTDKWLSSNSTLSNPGGVKKAITWTEIIEPFYIMKYPVTQQLYHLVMHEEDMMLNHLHMTEVSWIDSINFCNILSRMLGKTECYTVTNESEKTTYRSYPCKVDSKKRQNLSCGRFPVF
ncbi:formylglycine-generating enzyme family protein [Paenibacillus sp. JJ-223]|uniref:formylglycine-generating enzyme family protein n=1 Tax=Paenibacillus sp. JJ-223 TaxID=2905647 RepID=UPI001F4066B6|nr:formylglycine-generating enzyme family protein [Paenibacillus sp. JJ-223]